MNFRFLSLTTCVRLMDVGQHIKVSISRFSVVARLVSCSLQLK